MVILDVMWSAQVGRGKETEQRDGNDGDGDGVLMVLTSDFLFIIHAF